MNKQSRLFRRIIKRSPIFAVVCSADLYKQVACPAEEAVHSAAGCYAPPEDFADFDIPFPKHHIWINQDCPCPERILTVFHELSHYICDTNNCPCRQSPVDDRHSLSEFHASIGTSLFLVYSNINHTTKEQLLDLEWPHMMDWLCQPHPKAPRNAVFYALTHQREAMRSGQPNQQIAKAFIEVLGPDIYKNYLESAKTICP